MSDARARRVLRFGRNVADLPRALDFYCGALGFHLAEGAHDARQAWTHLPSMENVDVRGARLRLGEQDIELTEFDPPGARYPCDSTSADLWFQHFAIVTDDMRAAHARVMRHGATPISLDGPQHLPPSSGGVSAFKFRDPDGHPLELIAFPSGGGDPAWRTSRAQQPTLGIDHSAISVGDADRSIAFYARLGLTQTARQINRGIEQEHLDALRDVEVDVVALQASLLRTPHIELLDYRRPRGRAANAQDIRDIAADRIVLQVENLRSLLDELQNADTGIATSDADPCATLLRDPGGHLLELIE